MSDGPGGFGVVSLHDHNVLVRDYSKLAADVHNLLIKLLESPELDPTGSSRAELQRILNAARAR